MQSTAIGNARRPATIKGLIPRLLMDAFVFGETRVGLENHSPFSAHPEAERTDNRPMKLRIVALNRKRDRRKLLETTPGETVLTRGQESDPIPTACHDIFATWTLSRLCGAGGVRPEARSGERFARYASSPPNIVSPPTRFRFHFVTIPPFTCHSTSLACHANT